MPAWFDGWALGLAVFLPLAGTAVLTGLPANRRAAATPVALASSGLALLAGIGILLRYHGGTSILPAASDGSPMRFEVRHAWLPGIGAGYHVGIDGISLPLLELSLLLSFLCVVYASSGPAAPGNPRAFFALMLALETGVNGTFVALDLILFFVFFELVLIPMYFLIAVWGGPRREYAAIKFLLYTLIGSVFMLLGFIALWYRSAGGSTGGSAGGAAGGLPARTFDLLDLERIGAATHAFAGPFGLLVFAAIGFGFAVKVPVWPFHTWLPDAHTEAPTVGSVLLAGVLLKLGAYGFIRVALPVLPEAARSFAPLLAVLGVVAIVYGSLCCLAQRDVKRLIAYSSVGHMGFVVLGIATLTPAGINAAIFAMVAHGVITGLLFFLAGSIHDRYHTRDLVEIGGGVAATLPRLSGVLTATAIASLGLPGLAGFWGEVLAVVAAFKPAAGLPVGLFKTLGVIAAVGTLLVAAYFLWLLQRLTLGRPPERWSRAGLRDAAPLELAAWAPLLALTLGFGLAPPILFNLTNPSVLGWFGSGPG